MDLFDDLAELFHAAPSGEEYAHDYEQDALTEQAESPGWGLIPTGHLTADEARYVADWNTWYQNAALAHEAESGPGAATATQLLGVPSWGELVALHTGPPGRIVVGF